MSGEVWYEERGNIASLVEWMLSIGADHSEVVRMIEKPWQYDDLWAQYRAAKETDE